MASGGDGAKQERWRRPEGPGAPPFPREYDRFEGKRPMPDGRLPAFWIRDATSDQLPEISDHMVNIFLNDEQLSASTGIPQDETSLNDFRKLYHDALLGQRVTLVAMTDWPDGAERLAGCNVLGVVRDTDPKTQMKGGPAQKVFRAMYGMADDADLFRRYGVDHYLTGLGLSVGREFRGQDIGLRLLQAREPLCRSLGIPLTVTVFSGAGSQTQSARAGFDVVNEILYEDYELDGEKIFATAIWHCSQLKTKFYGGGSE